MFHCEKHLNDALHNPPRKRRTHTMMEIAVASRMLGRADDGLTRDRAMRAEAPRARATNALASNVRVVDGAVVRVDETTTARGASGAVSSKSLAASGALGRKAKRRKGLSEDNRWRTMDRIENGGTAGGDALREARRAVLGLSRRAAVAEDEDGPVVVPAEDLSFVDGWAVGKTEKTPKLIDEDARPTLEDERVMTVKPSQVTIGRKERKNRSKSSPAACGEGALSFDVDE